jgi:lipopolysaccharide export system protein LptA
MIIRLATLALVLAASQPALAEKADRDKPMLLEASRISIDDAKKQQILEGDVVITKGTLILKAERIIITEDQYGFQKGTAFAAPGSKATFRQKREGRDDYVEGEADRIEYDSNSEVVELFHRAKVRSGEDEVRGDYIWYDAVSEKFLASAAEARDPTGIKPRVRAVIQPRNKGSEAARPEKRGEVLELRGANTLTPQD